MISSLVQAGGEVCLLFDCSRYLPNRIFTIECEIEVSTVRDLLLYRDIASGRLRQVRRLSMTQEAFLEWAFYLGFPHLRKKLFAMSVELWR